jgi:hypothetical protein
MTFLPAQVQGRWFYLYLILDLFSRKVVGFEVHETDSVDHAAHLARRTALAEDVHATPTKPVLHGDNGATLKPTTHLLAVVACRMGDRITADQLVPAVHRTWFLSP